MEAHRVAVISDTHGLLRPETVTVLQSCEAILHAGDIGRSDILESLRAIAPTYAIFGNVDKGLAEELSHDLEIELFGFRFYLIHNKKQIRKELSGIDFVVYGHSHRYEEIPSKAMTYLNPGSCGPKRFRLPVTMMLLTLFPAEHRFKTERIECLRESGTERIRLPEKNMDKLVRAIIKDVNAGRQIADIAERNHVDAELAEQICRIYVTHPGVDVDGILNRMEIKNL